MGKTMSEPESRPWEPMDEIWFLWNLGTGEHSVSCSASRTVLLRNYARALEHREFGEWEGEFDVKAVMEDMVYDELIKEACKRDGRNNLW